MRRSGGFTVLESIVAIFILSMSISGAFSAVVQGLSQSAIAKDEIKAFYLAQEAFEIIKNKRDTNQIAKLDNPSITWLDGITDGAHCPFNQVCRADAVSNSLTFCGGWDSCPTLTQDPDTFLYGYGFSNNTNFKREIMIESVSADEISVTVRIKWTKGVVPYEFKVKTNLFNII